MSVRPRIKGMLTVNGVEIEGQVGGWVQTETSNGRIGAWKKQHSRKVRTCLVCGQEISVKQKYVYLPYWTKGAYQKVIQEDGSETVLYRPFTIALCNEECLRAFRGDMKTFIERLTRTDAFRKSHAINLL